MSVTKPEKSKIDDVVSPDEARKLIQKEQEERIGKCKVELEEILARYKCTIDVAMTISPTKIAPMIQIVAIE